MKLVKEIFPRILKMVLNHQLKTHLNQVFIESARLPEKLYRDTYVEYTIQLEEKSNRTKTLFGAHSQPRYNYDQQHTFDQLTEFQLNYLINGTMCFKVYGFQESKSKDTKNREKPVEVMMFQQNTQPSKQYIQQPAQLQKFTDPKSSQNFIKQPLPEKFEPVKSNQISQQFKGLQINTNEELEMKGKLQQQQINSTKLISSKNETNFLVQKQKLESKQKKNDVCTAF